MDQIFYRQVLLEGNFAAAQTVHEMLLQSRGGRIRIFPATPEKWKDATFTQLRAEGGFIVSANRKGGKTVEVVITATSNQLLRLPDPFEKQEFVTNMALERTENNEFQCQLKKGQTLRLSLR